MAATRKIIKDPNIRSLEQYLKAFHAIRDRGARCKIIYEVEVIFLPPVPKSLLQIGKARMTGFDSPLL